MRNPSATKKGSGRYHKEGHVKNMKLKNEYQVALLNPNGLRSHQKQAIR